MKIYSFKENHISDGYPGGIYDFSGRVNVTSHEGFVNQ